MNIIITLGKAGRLVVPKAIRDSLGLHEGSRLKLDIQGGELHAEPEPDPVNITTKDGFPVIQNGPPLKRDILPRIMNCGFWSNKEKGFATPF